MHIVLFVLLFAGGLFAGMLLLQEAGRRLGARRLAREPEGARAGLGAVEGAVFGLMGLLVAFTFSGAASRFETRRHLIVEEANAIGTAYLRLDLLPADAQRKLKDLFRRYLDARLEVYRRLPDVPAAKDALAESNALQGEIWSASLEAGRGATPASAMLTSMLVPGGILSTRATSTKSATVCLLEIGVLTELVSHRELQLRTLRATAPAR